MSRARKTVLGSVAIIVALAAVLLYYFAYVRAEKPVETTSKSPTAQSDYSDGEERSSSKGSDSSQGGAIDTRGNDVSSDGSGSITSESGVLTVYKPGNNAELASGTVVSGKATGVSKVQYRLLDDAVGVIAQGSLEVVNGSFSGKLQFNTKAQTGRLDIFTFSSSGVENDNIEIPVRFKE